jgi:PAS domain-containing protein
MEYWIFSAPWLVHFLDAWEHSTGESLWNRDIFRNWKFYLAHVLLPDGQNVFDFGDIWEGALTRAKGGAEYDRVYPGGTLQSNFNVMYRVAARLKDPEAQAVAERARLQAAVEQAAAEWQRTFDAVEPALLVFDSEARVVRLNRVATVLVGSAAAYQEILGRHVTSLGGGEPWPTAARLLASAVLSRTTASAEARDPSLGKAWALTVSIAPLGAGGAERLVDTGQHPAQPGSLHRSGQLECVRDDERRSHNVPRRRAQRSILHAHARAVAGSRPREPSSPPRRLGAAGFVRPQ